MPPTTELPSDRPRPAVKGFRGGRAPFTMPKAMRAQVTELARAEGTTAYVVMLAAYEMLLAARCGQKDVVVGTAMANRGRPELEAIFGCFANTVAIRTRLDGSPTFREVVARTRKAVVDAGENQDVPFARVVEMVQPARDPSRTPIYQVMFSYGESDAPFTLTGSEVSKQSIGLEVSLVDLWLMLETKGGELTGELHYDADLFEHASMERLVEEYKALLESALAEPERAVETLSLDPNARTVVLASTYAANAIQSSVASWLTQLGVPCRTRLATTNRILEHLEDPSSLLAGNASGGFNVLLVRFEDWRSAAGDTASVDSSARRLVAALRAASASGATYVVCVTPPSTPALADTGFAEHCTKTAAMLASELAGVSQVRILKSPPLAQEPAASPAPYPQAFCNSLGSQIARTIYRQVVAPK